MHSMTETPDFNIDCIQLGCCLYDVVSEGGGSPASAGSALNQK